MRKDYTLLFFVFISFSVTSQKITNGLYFTQKNDIGYTAEAFEFYGKNLFRYINQSCTGTVYGQGYYHITDKDSLVLNFEHTELSEQQKKLTIETCKSDSLQIDLVILIENEIPLQSAVIINNDKQYPKDENSKVTLRLKRTESDQMLKIISVGMQPMELKISKETCKISGSVAFSFVTPIPSETKYHYKLLQLQKSDFTIKTNGSHRTQRKVSSWKMARKQKKYMPNFYTNMFSNFFTAI